MLQTDILSLIIFAGIIILFAIDILPMATTAILGCTAMVLLGVCDFKTAFGQFSSSTVILTIGVMIIGSSISSVGLAKVIGRWIVKTSKGSETKLIVGTYIVSILMSAFLTNSAVLAIFIPIIMGVAATGNGFKSKTLIMPITYGCVIGGASTLVGSTQQMTAQGLLEESGFQTFRIFDFTPIVAVIALLGLLYCLFIGRKIGNMLWGNEEEGAQPGMEYSKFAGNESTDKKKMIIMAFIFAFSVVCYITEWIPIAVTSTTAALLCIITGCISQGDAVKSVNWNIVGRLAACLGIAKALEQAGGTALLSAFFQRLIGSDVNPYLLFCVLVLMVQVISEFISNSTAILLVLPVMISIAPTIGLNPYTYALGITIASGIAMSNPLASSTLGMSMVVGYKFTDYFKYSFAFDVMAYITIITLVPLFYGLML